MYLHFKRASKGGGPLDKTYVRNDAEGIIRTKTSAQVSRFEFNHQYNS